MSDIGPV